MLLRALLTSSAVLLLACPARAQGTQTPQDAVVLEYLPSRAAVKLCYPAEYFYDEIQIRLGYQLFQVTAPNHLTVKVDRVKDRFRSEFELRDDTGKVTLANAFVESNCTAALRSVLVVIAVHFTRLPEPPVCPPAPLPPAPSPPPPPAPVLPPPAPPADRPRFEGGLSSAFTIGKAPVVLGGAELFVGLRWRDYSAALGGRALLAPSAGLVDTSSAYIFAAASAAACVHIEWALACARFEVGSLYGSSVKGHIDPGYIPSRGVGIRIAGDRAITPVIALRPYLEVMGESVASRLRLSDRVNPIWTSPSLTASAGIGLVVTLARHSEAK
jgi:hypothetical protein